MDLLNNILEKNIKNYDINDIKELLFERKCSDIVNRNYTCFPILNYRKKYTFEKALKLSHDFLNTISKDYAANLLKRYHDNAFIIDYSDVSLYSNAFSNLIDGIPKIYIPFRATVDLSYTITHEFIHDTTILDDNDSITRNIFCEVPALFFERLQDKYLESIHHSDYYIHPRENASIIQDKALCISFELDLLQLFLENGYVTNSDLYELFCYYDNRINTVYNHLVNIIDSENITLLMDQRHILGYIISAYMMDRVEGDFKNSQEYFDLNEMINIYNPLQYLHYLSLEENFSLSTFDLTDESYQKLEASYKNQLKKIK